MDPFLIASWALILSLFSKEEVEVEFVLAIPLLQEDVVALLRLFLMVLEKLLEFFPYTRG